MIPAQNGRRARVAREQGLHVIRQTCCVAALRALAALALLLLLVQGTQAKVPTCFRRVLSSCAAFSAARTALVSLAMLDALELSGSDFGDSGALLGVIWGVLVGAGA